MNEESTLEEIEAIDKGLSTASDHNLQVEVVLFALHIVKKNPKIAISRAMELAVNEWIK